MNTRLTKITRQFGDVPVSPLRLGLIGSGRIAQSAHVPAIEALAGHVKLCAVADLDVASAKQVADRFGAAAYSDYCCILARSDIEAVIVATPEAVHAEQVCAAAAAGKHILCEKPIARSLEEADAMIAACEKADVQLLIGHSRRFTSRYLEISRLLRDGAIGEVRLMRENERRIRGFGGGTTMWTPAHWTGDPSRNQGIELMAGIHEADIFRWFIGCEPDSIYAEHAAQTDGNVGVADFVSFTVRFANGAIASSEISRIPPTGYPALHELEIYGTNGAIRAKDNECISILRYRDDSASFDGNFKALFHGGPIYARQLSAFVAMIRERRPAEVSPLDARQSLAMALAAVESAQTGKVVPLGHAISKAALA